MAKKKLFRFSQIKQMRHVFEPTLAALRMGYEKKGRWSDFFQNDNPLVLELGCGAGDYTLSLAKQNPHRNYIGVDIKGDRIWRGAQLSLQMKNVAFLRAQIDHIALCFLPGEISDIWITFPDPQAKLRRAKHRLVHPMFLDRYAELLNPGGFMHLKTDSDLLYGYAMGVLEYRKDFKVRFASHDLYTCQNAPLEAAQIQTYYEQKFLSKGSNINYLEVERVKV